MKLPDEFLDKISKLDAKTKDIIPKVLEAGARPTYRKVKQNLSSVIGKNTKTKSKSTGKLLSSLGVSPVGKSKNGSYNIKIGMRENRGDGVSNALLANVLEYGKSGQPAKPFLKPAVRATKNSSLKAMADMLESELGKV